MNRALLLCFLAFLRSAVQQGICLFKALDAGLEHGDTAVFVAEFNDDHIVGYIYYLAVKSAGGHTVIPYGHLSKHFITLLLLLFLRPYTDEIEDTKDKYKINDDGNEFLTAHLKIPPKSFQDSGAHRSPPLFSVSVISAR